MAVKGMEPAHNLQWWLGGGGEKNSKGAHLSLLRQSTKTNNMPIIKACQENFGYRLPSEFTVSRPKKSEFAFSF